MLRSLFKAEANALDIMFRKQKKAKLADHVIMRRKEKKKYRGINIHSPEHTGEKLLHKWLSPQRLRAIMLSYQGHRNKNRFNTEVDKNDKRELRALFEKWGDQEYKELREHQILESKWMEKVDECIQEIENLPVHLKEELEQEKKLKEQKPETLVFNRHYNMYWEQYQYILSDEYLEDFNVAHRFQQIYEENLKY